MAAAIDSPGQVPGQVVGQAPESARLDDVTAAQRYARLLVSEIKLYHEADVVAGRRDRDLVRRLGGEIARARVLYDQRVPSAVRWNGRKNVGSL